VTELFAVGVNVATFALLVDAIESAQRFIYVFVSVYVLIVLAYIITSWIRLPYSPWLNRVQRFLYDVCEPYLRLFRRILPPLGPLDLSPIVAVFVLLILSQLLIAVLDQFH
jgi:YggT family protein